MFNYTPKEQALANEFADKLKDHRSIKWHLLLARNYEEWSLREQLETALEKPDDEVITTRARIYTSLVKRNGVRKNTRN